jgi:hypothetical protein
VPKVLLIEDDEALARGLEYNLVREGFEVVRARRGDTAADVIVFTHSNFRRRLHIPASLPATVEREGGLLYAAA